MTIEKNRQEIDRLDAQILDLLNRRAKAALEIGKAKKKQAADAFVPWRERQVLERLAKRNKGPLSDAAVLSIYRQIIAASRQLLGPTKVAYFGPQGTFTHIAALQKFGELADLRPIDSIADVFAEVEKGNADYGVVPMENSTEGVIRPTLDMFVESSLSICAEIYLDIAQHLLSNSPFEQITRIYSMPQPFAQCRTWIKTNLPRAELVEVASTAKAAQIAAKEPGAAAIGTDLAARLYKLKIVREHIEDTSSNRTRFLVIGQAESRPSGKDKTSIMFSVKHQAGALYRTLAVLDKYDINMTMIESRPTRQKPWEYIFFVDFLGHQDEPRVAKALEHLREGSLFLRVLGSYPEAE
jgi:chorismate mutase/prephenate dehydratase